MRPTGNQGFTVLFSNCMKIKGQDGCMEKTLWACSSAGKLQNYCKDCFLETMDCGARLLHAACLSPKSPEFDSWTACHMWAELAGSLP